jgi:amino acid adenylation domain-containing protein
MGIDPADRLEELARRCGVAPQAAAVAALALLLRRYTGRAEQVIEWAGRTLRLDLTADTAVRDLLARVADSGDLGFLDGLWHVSESKIAESLPAGAAGAARDDLVAMLAAMAADPDRSTVDLLPVAAYERAPRPDLTRLHGGPRPDPSFGPDDTIVSAFAAQVARHPDRPAVLADDARLTYRELASAVAKTAAAIAAAAGRGTLSGPVAGPGRVAVLCRHGAGTVIALLGALASGRAYVPLDPAYPVPRLAEILADSDADVLVTDPANDGLAARVLLAADRRLPAVHYGHADDPDHDPADLRDDAAHPDDPAYLLYTSGSTGRPKGVVQNHRNVLAGIANHIRNFALTPDDRTSVLTSFGFDMAVTDTFGALLCGAAAVPVDVRAHGLGHLAGALRDRGVTIYHATPTVYRYLLASLGPDGRLPGIRAVLLGGEEVTRHDVDLARRHFGPRTVFVNGYGTTEISFAAQCHVPPDAAPLDRAVVPIGAPLPGIDVVLVDPAGRPTCLTGEILVRAPHVALGYWRRPDLTAHRFVTHRGVRAYRTGDLARRLPDGQLVFLGRADRLVKIRGHRVELGEVEARLAALPGVGQAAVIARGDQILGYAVPARGAALDPSALRAALATELPDFMLPRAVVLLDALPMGPTGKLDVAALPAPSVSTVDEVVADPLERAIADVWGEVLGHDRVDPHASFVDLGGHSLHVALVQQRLESVLGRRVPLVRLIEHPTVAALAAHLRTCEPSGAPDRALQSAAERMSRRRAARGAT